MNREEAIEVLSTYDMSEDNEDKEFIEAIKMAISALSAEGEYIKKEDVLKFARNPLNRVAICEYVEKLPTYSFPDREKGEWIPMYDRWGDIVTTVCGYECSKCGEWNADNDKFCPNCGADMRGDKAE